MADDVTKNFNYKQFQKYYSKAVEYSQNNDEKRSQQQARSALRYAETLKKKGMDDTIQSEVQRLNDILASDVSATSSLKARQQVTKAAGGDSHPLSKDFNYKQFQKYYAKARTYAAAGDVRNGHAQTTSAMKYAVKLQDKGLGDSIVSEFRDLERIIEKFDSMRSDNQEVKNAAVQQRSRRPDKERLMQVERAKAKERLERNSEEKLDFRKFSDKLPRAVKKDKKLEKDMMDAITSVYHAVITVEGAILTSDQWVVTRNAREHYRSMDAVILARHIGEQKNLGCFYQYFDFRQRPNGNGGWSRPGRNSSGARYYIDCSKM